MAPSILAAPASLAAWAAQPLARPPPAAGAPSLGLGPGSSLSRAPGQALAAAAATAGAATSLSAAARRLRPRAGRCRAGRCRAAPRAAPRLRAFEGENGAIAPLGYWDPLGFSLDGDAAEFRRRREAELKNGRVAMYATLGYIVPEYYKFPGYLSPGQDLLFKDVPNGIGALNAVPLEGWLQIIAYCGFFELVINGQYAHPTEPGNFTKGRWGIFWGRIIKDAVERRTELNRELSHSRLAMIAIVGMVSQNGVVGSTGPEMWIPGIPAAAAEP